MANAIAQKLQGIEESMNMSGREIAKVLRTTPETISRWRTGKSDPQPRMRDGLLHLHWLATQLAELYPPQDAHLWLFSYHKMLDGHRAVDLIESGQGERVLQVIAQLKDGAYT